MVEAGRLAHRSIRDGSAEPVHDDADFVIVGSGAAGAAVAAVLSEAGRSVVVVEEGPPPKPAADGLDALRSLYRDGGAQAAIGGDLLPLLQGRSVGGTTVINGGIQVPLPEAVWREWVARDPRWARRLPWSGLEAAREELDRALGVAATPPELWGGSGGAMRRALGDRAEPTRRNTPGCRGSGRCLEGCPHGAKRSADVALLPRAIDRGARIYARCRVRGLLIRGGRASGVRGTFEGGARLEVIARRAVIVAAGAIQSAALVRQAGVRGAGRGFMCHPGAAMAGLFPSPLPRPEATQSMQSLSNLGAGIKLESLGMPAAFKAARVPGVGALLEARLERLDRVALWGVAARAEARGRVVPSPLGPLVLYTPAPRDRHKLVVGLAQLAELMLAAGASEVWPAIHGAPEVITDPAAARDLARIEPRPGAIPMVATHLFGGVEVDDAFQAGGVRGLVVADSAIFPSNIGVNPMSAIGAVATVVAQRWAGG